MGNPETGQLIMRMRGRSRPLKFGEIRDHVKVERRPRKSQHCSGKIGRSAIVQVPDQAHPSEPRPDHISR
jgi:hypothetical protein